MFRFAAILALLATLLAGSGANRAGHLFLGGDAHAGHAACSSARCAVDPAVPDADPLPTPEHDPSSCETCVAIFLAVFLPKPDAPPPAPAGLIALVDLAADPLRPPPSPLAALAARPPPTGA